MVRWERIRTVVRWIKSLFSAKYCALTSVFVFMGLITEGWPRHWEMIAVVLGVMFFGDVAFPESERFPGTTQPFTWKRLAHDVLDFMKTMIAGILWFLIIYVIAKLLPQYWSEVFPLFVGCLARMQAARKASGEAGTVILSSSQ